MIHPSLFWKKHFENNLVRERINWSLRPHLTAEEKKQILYSLKAWQLGETSEGKHLLAASEKYARKTCDPDYVDAVKLFIREEQKHGSNLGKYIDMLWEPRARSDWGDSIFRKIRYFNTSMELWTITVIIVESAAQVFYRALHDATGCLLLKSICHDILTDEAHHIKFQNERLYVIFRSKTFYAKAFSLLWYSILFFGTIHAVWIGHKTALKAGGVSKKDFMRMMYYKFFQTLKFIHDAHEEPVLYGSLVSNA